eukprot:m.22087 g.22087  ORF g.22087 m.22087 type:complete len:616 (-) comp7338_c0_seq1:96-1943(-)
MNVVLLALLNTLTSKDGTPSFLFILGDDIGWADFGYNNGTASTPRVDAWARKPGTIVMQDLHSGGTVCSPTRATVLTGRNHFRDCVDYVYGCSDMTECVPHFNFAPQRTFTIGDAVRKSNKGYESLFVGKWHLGSFYNDSEAHGGITSSPVTHGFDHFNATVEVAPTATTNCQCTTEWDKTCDFGHYNRPNHCSGKGNPGGPSLPGGCCFNYWWNNESAPHAVTNLSNPVGLDDSLYVADVFTRFLEGRNGAPFLAQLSFHNCHIPFIGTPTARQSCSNNETCKPPLPNSSAYGDGELDFYACMSELDHAIGLVLDALENNGYYENTMIWLATDNGPEENCPPEGFCRGTLHRPMEGPGCAGPLRGRKRDIYEGGHRVPGIISWPAIVGNVNKESWDTVITMDFLATIMDVLNISRPATQQTWAMDGVSVMPILRGEPFPERGLGWMYMDPGAKTQFGFGFRYGPWKFVQGSVSCKNDDCAKPQLYNLDSDLSEQHDVADKNPEVLQMIQLNFSRWHLSILNSMVNESKCTGAGPPGPIGPVSNSTNCTFTNNMGLEASDAWHEKVHSQEECCGLCRNTKGCVGGDFNKDGTCHMKVQGPNPTPRDDGSVACIPK